MATQASLTVWAEAWQKTAADYTTIATQERNYATMRTLPASIRRQSNAAAIKAEQDASFCRACAEQGVRF